MSRFKSSVEQILSNNGLRLLKIQLFYYKNFLLDSHSTEIFILRILHGELSSTTFLRLDILTESKLTKRMHGLG